VEMQQLAASSAEEESPSWYAETGHDSQDLRKTAYPTLVVPPFAAQWAWEGSPGRFYAFPLEANNEIEAQHYERQLNDQLDGVPAHVLSGGSSYKISFDELTQENTSSGRTRKIRRELVKAQWYWSGRGGEKWYAFAENVNQFIEAGFQTWRFCDGVSRTSLPISDSTYDVDFERLTQCNTSTGRMRDIKRELVGAANACETNAYSSNVKHASRQNAEGLDAGWNLTLKVTLQPEIRRFSCTIPHGAGGEKGMSAIQGAVENGFPALVASKQPYSLYYQDRDGDRCLLVAETWKDCVLGVRWADAVLKLTLILGGSGSSGSTSAASLHDDAPCQAAVAGPAAVRSLDWAEANDEEDDEEEEDAWAIV